MVVHDRTRLTVGSHFLFLNQSFMVILVDLGGELCAACRIAAGALVENPLLSPSGDPFLTIDREIHVKSLIL